MIKDRVAIRQSELSQNIIDSRSIDFMVGAIRNEHTIVLCFAHVQIEFPSNSTYTVSKKKVIGDSLISRYYSIFIRNKDLSLRGSRRLG